MMNLQSSTISELCLSKFLLQTGIPNLWLCCFGFQVEAEHQRCFIVRAQDFLHFLEPDYLKGYYKSYGYYIALYIIFEHIIYIYTILNQYTCSVNLYFKQVWKHFGLIASRPFEKKKTNKQPSSHCTKDTGSGAACHRFKLATSNVWFQKKRNIKIC